MDLLFAIRHFFHVEAMIDGNGARILSVSSDYRDGDVIISVADTGSRIQSEDVHRVFNPLFTTKPGGMGLGLSICRSIIEGHRGTLGVIPNAPRGAVF